MSAPETAQRGPRLYSLAALVDDAAADAQARYEARVADRLIGPRTAIPKLTEALGGCLSPGVHILHGSPGSGKTAFALQTACTCGGPALFVTCEMAPIELLRRITARVTETYLGRLKTGEIRPDAARELYTTTARRVPDLAILDATAAPLSPAELLDFAKTLRDRERDTNPHFLIVIDSVHSWASAIPTEATEYDKLNAALDAIRQIAAQLDSPALCIAERNRMSMSGGGQSASAGTRRFEYGAESVIELNREPNAEADAYGDIAVTMRVSKNRHGATTGNTPLLFNGRMQAFREG